MLDEVSTWTDSAVTMTFSVAAGRSSMRMTAAWVRASGIVWVVVPIPSSVAVMV